MSRQRKSTSVRGQRRDQYRIYDDDVWSAITMQRVPLLRRWEGALAEGVELLGTDRPGGRRPSATSTPPGAPVHLAEHPLS